MNKRVTMADVARTVGVSQQTVSRAINDKGEISAETKSLVLEAVKRLGYRPSGIARSLATQRTTTIGLVVPDIANPFFSGIARGIEEVAFANNYNLFLCNADEDIDRERSALDSLFSKQVDGLILCSSRLDQEELLERLAKFRYTVLFNKEVEGPHENLRTIAVDDTLGTQIALGHLFSRGHRRIAFVAGPERSWSSQLRLTSFRQAYADHGYELDEGLIRHCMPDIQAGFEMTSRLIESSYAFSALLAFNDLVAIGALQACMQLNRSVPEDLAVMGSDDIQMASYIKPALTTLHVPQRVLGETAMRMLMGMMSPGEGKVEKVYFKPKLVVRESAP